MIMPEFRGNNLSTAFRGFTLIELLCVVGLLLVLSGIGMSNWSEAVTRAKVSRVRGDFHALSTALNLYQIDAGVPARMRHADIYQDPNIDSVEGIPVNGILSPCLSTPVAYLSTVSQLDPFTVGIASVPLDEQFYTYQVLSVYVKERPTSTFWPAAKKFYGPWRLISAGPDRYFDHNFINSAQLPYDATNGTTSLGNVIRSARHSETVMPPIPDLLAPH